MRPWRRRSCARTIPTRCDAIHSSVITGGLAVGTWAGGRGIDAGYGLTAPLWVGAGLALLGPPEPCPASGAEDGFTSGYGGAAALGAVPVDFGNGMIGKCRQCLASRTVLRLHGHAMNHCADESGEGAGIGLIPQLPFVDPARDACVDDVEHRRAQTSDMARHRRVIRRAGQNRCRDHAAGRRGLVNSRADSRRTRVSATTTSLSSRAAAVEGPKWD